VLGARWYRHQVRIIVCGFHSRDACARQGLTASGWARSGGYAVLSDFLQVCVARGAMQTPRSFAPQVLDMFVMASVSWFAGA